MSDHHGVLICGEVVDDHLATITTELLGVGRRLADHLRERLFAVLIGSSISIELAQECIYFGADNVFVIDDPIFDNYLTDSYVAAMEDLTQYLKPDIVLFGQTSMGRDLAPRLAYRLGTGVTLDCIELFIDPETNIMHQTKPVYGGNANAIYTCETRPQLASIRPKTMLPLERDPLRKGDIVPFVPNIDLTAIRGRVVDHIKEELTGINLVDADVVVCVGRGSGGPKGIEIIHDLANAIHAALGATRPVCDNGWLPEQTQIGLTGKTVAPRLYIGIALSGAVQHLAGMRGAKNVVAINKDPDANIFRVAHYGVIADYHTVIPSFLQKYTVLRRSQD